MEEELEKLRDSVNDGLDFLFYIVHKFLDSLPKVVDLSDEEQANKMVVMLNQWGGRVNLLREMIKYRQEKLMKRPVVSDVPELCPRLKRELREILDMMGGFPSDC
jgi:hypothetical protein